MSDRDFVAEFLFVGAMIGVHLSRLAEEVILMCSPEFGWARLHDSWSTGSSIMPQKKNPDIAELARGKSGRLIGNLTGLLATLKGSLRLQPGPAGGQGAGLRHHRPAAPRATRHGGHDCDAGVRHRPDGCVRATGFAPATEIADWLVVRGVPFRDAHEISGACVAAAEARGVELWDLTDEELAAAPPLLTPRCGRC